MLFHFILLMGFFFFFFFQNRLCWLVVILGALCGLVYQLVRSTQKFSSHDTTTNLKYIKQDTLDFPSVTFCNTNMFT